MRRRGSEERRRWEGEAEVRRKGGGGEERWR